MTETITQTLRHGDLRAEEMRRGSGLSGRITISPPVPSANLAKTFEALKSGDLARMRKMADKIEAGEATGDEAESLQVYEDYAHLLDYVEDLAGMCLRREEALAELGIHIGVPSGRR